MAALAGYAVTVIDPRRAFATDSRFPGHGASRSDWPDEAMANSSPTARTAVVTLTHDPKLDDPALEAALRSEAFYIGALGSRKTHAARLARLKAAGFDDAALARIHGPVGLSIDAQSPAEIAVSDPGADHRRSRAAAGSRQPRTRRMIFGELPAGRGRGRAPRAQRSRRQARAQERAAGCPPRT